MNIYLVGFMGTGKTSVGRLLAEKKNRLESRGSASDRPQGHGLASCGQSHSRSQWNFIDLDELIELKEQRRIVDIFAREGEPYFRKIEKKALKEVCGQKKFVVACGGGVVLDKDNIKVMKKSGILVCLTATPKEIFKRVSVNTQRPLLNVENPARRIELLLKMRAPYYMQADKIIDTSRLSIKEVVEKISKIPGKKK